MAESVETLKQSILRRSRVVDGGHPRIHVIPMHHTVRDEEAGLEKLEFGCNHGRGASKVIMMVGQTGSGKTTLINGLVNYVFGVDWNDSFRFKMIVEGSHADQAESQTRNVTSYTLHHQDGFRMPYSLTIIDTPGFGDTKGIKRDREIVEQLRKFFTSPGDLGISHIDAIGFVVQASQARLSVGQKYVFDSILALFGKDISDNIFLLVTFADGQEPEVLSAVKKAEIPYKDYFQFNNSALYYQTDKRRKFGSLFWDMGCESFQIFLDKVLEIESKSLVLTKNVLRERKKIEEYIESIQREMKVGLSKLNTLEKEKEMLRKHEHDVDQNKNFSFEVEEDVFVKKDCDENGYKYKGMHNCMKCERTCCHWCWGYSLGVGGRWCCSMNKEMMCMICGCSLEEHRMSNYMYEVSRKTTMKTVAEIRLRFTESLKEKHSALNMIDEIQREYDLGQKKILHMADSVRKSLDRLKEIALRPDPLSTVEYIDIMIKNEQRDAKAGWQERVDQLILLKKRAKETKKYANWMVQVCGGK
ncbi:uncharacterized protein LOC135108143 [Scylla paramamosain]|uniref:uncharacterized protein LOC135108143 n=1 Tax=Scylla paramamosain TaxID=85552 RepID=UPI0030833442